MKGLRTFLKDPNSMDGINDAVMVDMPDDASSANKRNSFANLGSSSSSSSSKQEKQGNNHNINENKSRSNKYFSYNSVSHEGSNAR